MSVLPAHRLAWLPEFVRFGAVGAVGFVANVAIVYLFGKVVGLYVAGILAWLGAATITWCLHRLWTFRNRGAAGPVHQQWLLYLCANFAGFILYYGTYAGLITYSSLCAKQPVAGVIAGALVGLIANFTISRRLAFT